MAEKMTKQEIEKTRKEARKALKALVKQMEEERNRLEKERERLKKNPPEAIQYVEHSYLEVNALLRELDKFGKRLIISFNDASYENLQQAMDVAGSDIDVRAEKKLIAAQTKNIELTINAIIGFIRDSVDRTITEENKLK